MHAENPLKKIYPTIRALLYVGTLVSAALMGGFERLGQEAPDWLIFIFAVIGILASGTAMSNIDWGEDDRP